MNTSWIKLSIVIGLLSLANILQMCLGKGEYELCFESTDCRNNGELLCLASEEVNENELNLLNANSLCNEKLKDFIDDFSKKSLKNKGLKRKMRNQRKICKKNRKAIKKLLKVQKANGVCKNINLCKFGTLSHVSEKGFQHMYINMNCYRKSPGGDFKCANGDLPSMGEARMLEYLKCFEFFEADRTK